MSVLSHRNSPTPSWRSVHPGAGTLNAPAPGVPCDVLPLSRTSTCCPEKTVLFLCWVLGGCWVPGDAAAPASVGEQHPGGRGAGEAARGDTAGTTGRRWRGPGPGEGPWTPLRWGTGSVQEHDEEHTCVHACACTHEAGGGRSSLPLQSRSVPWGAPPPSPAPQWCSPDGSVSLAEPSSLGSFLSTRLMEETWAGETGLCHGQGVLREAPIVVGITLLPAGAGTGSGSTKAGGMRLMPTQSSS